MKVFFGSIIVMVISFTAAIILFSVSGLDDTVIEKKFKSFNFNFNPKTNNFSFTSANNLSFDFENSEVIKREFAIGTISMIDIKGIDAADIEITDIAEGTQIKVELECAVDFLKTCQDMIQLKNGILQVSGKPLNGTRNFIKNLKILLPPNAFNLNLALGVGDITLKNLTLAKVNITLGTGDIEVVGLKAESIVFKNGTGDIELKELNIDNITQIKSGVGNIELEVLNPTPIVSIKSGTGNVVFKTLKDKNFTLEVKTGIGSKDLASGYTKQNGQYVYGKGDGKVMIKSGVGSIEVY